LRLHDVDFDRLLDAASVEADARLVAMRLQHAGFADTHPETCRA
jgi:hypothetical protein